MRVVLVSSNLMIAACGGTKKPAEPPESPSSETSSSAASDTATDSDSGSAEAPTAPAASAPAEAAPEAAPAPASPSPTVTGTIDGKPFAPKTARIIHPMQKDGRVAVILDEHSDCNGGDAKPGEGVLTMTITLEDGYKRVDSARSSEAERRAEATFCSFGWGRGQERLRGGIQAHWSRDGRARSDGAERGRQVEPRSTSGDYMLSGDVDLQACVAPKGAAKGAAKKKK